ncbi:MAG: ABC transporter ATP-binding protein [Hyphomicrobiales bacterium]|nr:ABC transporter ATP-binding protein [Hyphomicrobiales bacterium]
MTAALSLSDVTLGYDGHPAVHHLTGRFEPGSLTAVCGPNGAGKSTLVKALAGVLKPIGGRIDRGGLLARDIGYLPQAAEIDRAFPIDVFDFVALGRIRRAGLFGRLGAADRKAAQEAISAVGLEGLERRQIGALSGGQTQRMMFARLMAQDSRVILLDEPFAAVDERTMGDLVGLIAQWHAQGRTLVAVLHDFALVRAYFPRTLLLARECIAWGPTDDALAASNLAKAQAMSEAFDDDAGDCERAA